ncbi:MAG: hypothetical protein WC942_10220 [Clostridia bacterium]
MSMKILNQHEGEGTEYLLKTHTYIRVYDYGDICILKGFSVNLGETRWKWVNLKKGSDNLIDMKEFYTTFDAAINRATNDMYSTVYEFSSFDAVIRNWDDIKYINSIKKVFKGSD